MNQGGASERNERRALSKTTTEAALAGVTSLHQLQLVRGFRVQNFYGTSNGASSTAYGSNTNFACINFIGFKHINLCLLEKSY